MSCSRTLALTRASNFANLLADIVRDTRPRPTIVWSSYHHVSASYITLVATLAMDRGQQYDHKIAELVEAFYGLESGHFGLPRFKL